MRDDESVTLSGLGPCSTGERPAVRRLDEEFVAALAALDRICTAAERRGDMIRAEKYTAVVQLVLGADAAASRAESGKPAGEGHAERAALAAVDAAWTSDSSLCPRLVAG